jgi:hypothetical protein
VVALRCNDVLMRPLVYSWRIKIETVHVEAVDPNICFSCFSVYSGLNTTFGDEDSGIYDVKTFNGLSGCCQVLEAQ